MKPAVKITILDENGEKFFGEGPCSLLQAVQQTGSLRAAAISMGMAYSKATRLIRQAEEALGFPLTTRTAGGKDGGGSTLTPEGKRWLQRYEAYKAACSQASEALFREYFPRTGCVILASGLGKRFGGNKLMADYHGEPMILRALEATQNLFDKRVVVTRHADVADLCQARGIQVVLHDLPHRSDTVRLGLEAVGDVDCCCFCPGDQPRLRRETVAQLLKNHAADPQAIWRPAFDGIPGSPVCFPRWAFPELKNLPEGKGGAAVMLAWPDKVRTMPVMDPFELADADTPETLELLRRL